MSGIKTRKEFDRLRRVLEPFTAIHATKEHHVLAAELFNTCKYNGLNVSPTDALIAATAIHCKGRLVTGDNDFRRMTGHIDLVVDFMD